FAGQRDRLFLVGPYSQVRSEIWQPRLSHKCDLRFPSSLMRRPGTLPDQSIRNPKRQGVADKDRKSAADSSDDGFAPRTASQGSRKQCQDERNPELAENDVPRRERNHAATTVLPPMNSRATPS